MRKNGKGQPIDAIMKQVLCFFVDGTSRHLVHFDRLKEDAGYAGAIGRTPGDFLPPPAGSGATAF